MASKNPLQSIRGKNVQESIAEVAHTAKDSIKSELGEEWKTFLQQTLEVGKAVSKEAHQVEGELREGEELILSDHNNQEKHLVHIEPGIEYAREIIHAESNHLKAENHELRQRLSEIHAELDRISKASKELEAVFKDVSRETMNMGSEPGKYHVNFFEWILSTIQNARERIESASTWVSAISSKSAKKDYWSLSQKHGTSYSLSSERVVAQQVG